MRARYPSDDGDHHPGSIGSLSEEGAPKPWNGVRTGKYPNPDYIREENNMDPEIQIRREKYFALNTRLAYLSNTELDTLCGEKAAAEGWGGTHTIEIGGEKVFIKRVPLTEREYEHAFSTANLFNLPLFYNYGVGSAGFGAFRELAAHVKTTNWVLNGAIANFPLMYHSRIIPVMGSRPELDAERHERYINYWNSDPNIDQYMRARYSAPYDLVLCLEYIPDVLAKQVVAGAVPWEPVIRKLQDAIGFLRANGVIHFDVHFWNVLVRGETPYITDFGLVLDQEFALTPEEQNFLNNHQDYDFSQLWTSIGGSLLNIYEGRPEEIRAKVREVCGFNNETHFFEKLNALFDNLERIRAEGWLNLDYYYVTEVVRHMDLIHLKNAFFTELMQNSTKDAVYPTADVRRLLELAGGS